MRPALNRLMSGFAFSRAGTGMSISSSQTKTGSTEPLLGNTEIIASNSGVVGKEAFLDWRVIDTWREFQIVPRSLTATLYTRRIRETDP